MHINPIEMYHMSAHRWMLPTHDLLTPTPSTNCASSSVSEGKSFVHLLCTTDNIHMLQMLQGKVNGFFPLFFFPSALWMTTITPGFCVVAMFDFNSKHLIAKFLQGRLNSLN